MTWSSRSRRGSAWPSHSAIVQNAMLINSRSVHQQASYLTDHQPSVSRARVRILRTKRGRSDISCNGLHRSHHSAPPPSENLKDAYGFVAYCCLTERPS